MHSLANLEIIKMKMKIDWHEECLKNSRATRERMVDRMNTIKAEVDKMAREHALYQAQIDLAKKEKKDGFDCEKYAIKRLCV